MGTLLKTYGCPYRLFVILRGRKGEPQLKKGLAQGSSDLCGKDCSHASEFFSARIDSNKLHVLGPSAQSWWDPRRFNWWAKADVRAMLNPRAGDRFVTTHEELRAALLEPVGRCGPRLVWVHESLVDEVKRLSVDT
jgi:hypothetical protein